MKKNIKLSKIGLLVLSSIFWLNGCSNSASKLADQDYETTNKEITAHMKASQNKVQQDLFSVTDDFYTDKNPILESETNKKVDLPKLFKSKVNINIQNPTILSEITAKITRMTGVGIKIQQSLIDGTEGEYGDLIGNKGVGDKPETTSSTSSTNTNQSVEKEKYLINDIVYNGNLKGLLDNISNRLNLSWKWDGQVIQIYRYETKMFRLTALDGISTMEASLDTTSSSGGGDKGVSANNTKASSGQKTKFSNVTAIWADVGSSLQSTLSPNGKISMTPSAGTITVTDTPEVLSRIERQVVEFNRIYSKQVMLDISVYQVKMQNTDNYGVDWSAALEFAASRYGLNIASNGQNTGNGGNSWTITGSDGHLKNGKFMFEALSKIGKTSLLTNNTAISLNGQTVPVNVSREKAYVESAETTVDDGVITSSITPGMVTEGFSMNFTPRVTDENNVIMRYTIDLSTIESIESFSSGDTTVQLPQRSVRNFMQNVSIKSGQTLVLAGFQQVEGETAKSGTGSPSFWGFGGGKSAANNTNTIVIVVTPYITN